MNKIIKRVFFAAVIVSMAAFVSCKKDKPTPVITINTQPTANTEVTAGSISASLSVAASVTEGATLTYHWYSNTTNSNTSGIEISGAITANYDIPTNLAAGTYYYFCEVRATDAVSVRSNVATVTVSPDPSSVFDEGVEINDVKWATRNVGAPNTFVATPEDAGMFYQWNRTAAFSITDPMTSIGGSWADVASSAAEWEIANNVCPAGWRVPTKAEFESLIESGGTWVTTPANGFRFGSGANTIFFPAAGERFYDGTLVEGSTDGLCGSYWSSELRSASQPYLLAFDESESWISYFNGREGYCVRCVKDDAIVTKKFVKEE